MPKEIIMAVIAGIVGIAGGIIAWVQAIRTARLRAEADYLVEQMKSEAVIAMEKVKAEAAIALENMKAESERRQKAFEVAAQESKPVEAALGKAWHDIQSLKELIAKILAPGRYDLDLVLRDFNEAYSSLVEGYATWGSDLPNAARSAWHKAKGSADNIDFVLRRYKAAEGGNVTLPEDMAEVLREARQSLTDQQTLLAASRQTIREQQIGKILGVL